MTKTCSKCKQTKPKSEFHRSANANDGLQAYCKACNNAQMRAENWRKAGIDMDDDGYAELLKQQGGKCAVCETVDSGTKQFHVDHDHATGKVRGLLCGKCNTGIGSFDDDPDRMRKAADYVTKHRTAGGGPK